MELSSGAECIRPEYYKWLSSTALQCNSTSDTVEDVVYSHSSFLQSQFIVRPDSTTVSEEQVRILMGCLIVMSNLLLLIFLNSRASMRRRYIFFTLVSIGDILDGTYLIYPSIMRIGQMATGTFSGGTSLWGCASRGYMVFRIYGTELISVSMLIMSAEKAIAVLFIVPYRRYATNKARFITAAVCLLVCLFSLGTMFCTSYFDNRAEVQEDKYCGISGRACEASSAGILYDSLKDLYRFCEGGAPQVSRVGDVAVRTRPKVPAPWLSSWLDCGVYFSRKNA
ncbi:unnamed protein product [Strongylus vulgaris]|uniref:G-protein coupled receptors family 1 profile domain-containing protein n=1 Tax=Strongylus vulgaris TaxID=40348 RepID=A0A3P7JBD1_STRVU|nr:unnamed protein product [Strongylus vulgaris]